MASVIRGSDNFDSGTVGITLGTAVATTSGTSIDFTGIPAGTKRITVMFNGVSTNGTTDLIVQIGDSGGIETSGYVSTAMTMIDNTTSRSSSSTSGFNIRTNTASELHYGTMILVKQNSSDWISTGSYLKATDTFNLSAGGKTISSSLDRIRLTTTNGTDTFDAGSINISWE